MKELINHWSRRAKNPALGLLLIRIATGLVFLMHGWSKIGNLSGVEGMMVSFGFPAGVGIFIAWLEVIGGLALILGIFTRAFAKLFFIEMVVAIILTSMGKGFVYRAHELEIVLALLSLGILLTGSERYSLYPMECKKCGAMLCKGECGMQS